MGERQQKLVADAKAKGAKIINKNGGKLAGNGKQPIMVPAVLFPVDSTMKIWSEEQFGPVVPVATFRDAKALMGMISVLEHGQQCSVFGSPTDVKSIMNPL